MLSHVLNIAIKQKGCMFKRTDFQTTTNSDVLKFPESVFKGLETVLKTA